MTVTIETSPVMSRRWLGFKVQAPQELSDEIRAFPTRPRRTLGNAKNYDLERHLRFPLKPTIGIFGTFKSIFVPGKES